MPAEHREITDYGIDIAYWKDNTACLESEPWTRAVVSARLPGWAMPVAFSITDKRQLSDMKDLALAIFTKGREHQAKLIRHCLGIGDGFGDKTFQQIPVGRKS